MHKDSNLIYETYLKEALKFPGNEEIVVVYPGGFKLPHKGHFQVLKDSITSPEKDERMLPPATSAVVFIGKTPRDGFTDIQSKAIWEIYIKHIDVPVEVHIAEKSPVTSTYEFACENKDKIIYVVAGEEDLGRYDGFINCGTDEYAHVQIIPAPPKFDRISGTVTRNAILNKEPGALDFIPDRKATGQTKREAANDAYDIVKILNLTA